jgi:hypothetical protein
MSEKPIAKFVCEMWPKLRIRELQFKGGILYVFSAEEADLVRNSDGYLGGAIKELPLEFENPQIQTGPTANQGMQHVAAEKGKDEGSAHRGFATRRGGGWYLYRGKNYHLKDLPVGVKIKE